MQEFYIKQNSMLPQLRMEIIDDGRHDFWKFHEAIQNADITFTMTNVNSGLIKILNSPCYIKLKEDGGCEDEYVICYDWKKRDTNEKGLYNGVFTIDFGNDLKSDLTTYPSGTLIMPIREDLQIMIE
jgi:hypothetical protein